MSSTIESRASTQASYLKANMATRLSLITSITTFEWEHPDVIRRHCAPIVLQLAEMLSRRSSQLPFKLMLEVVSVWSTTWAQPLGCSMHAHVLWMTHAVYKKATSKHTWGCCKYCAEPCRLFASCVSVRFLIDKLNKGNALHYMTMLHQHYSTAYMYCVSGMSMYIKAYTTYAHIHGL